jgi:Flp pilus assembly protein TadG
MCGVKIMPNVLQRFCTDKRGNFAVMSVVAFPLLFAGVALAVDITDGLRMRSELQNANDGAVLFAANYYLENDKLPETNDLRKMVAANYGYSLGGVSATVDKNTREVTLKSDSTLQPKLMNYFGNRAQKFEAVSKAGVGVGGILEFSMALDTTWSMNFDGRMGGLKIAATNFVNMLMDSKDKGAEVKGAIVPFARYVNVGVSRRNESWMDVPKDIDTRKTTTSCVWTQDVVAWTNCKKVCWPASVVNHPAVPPSCWLEDGQQVCSNGSPAWTENKPAGCKNKCDPVYGAKYQKCTTTTSGQLITWNGCVGSRDYPYNVRDDFQGRKFPGLLGAWCGSEVLPLTNDRATLLAKVNALWPADNTYIPEGVMWGLRTLTATKPFTEGNGPNSNNNNSQAAKFKVRKGLILMTDGMNTIQASGAWHNDTGDATVPDRLTLEACDEAKAQGVEVYTVSFGNQVPVNIRSLLEKCATSPDLYNHAASNSALNDVFRKIGNSLLTIRLTQ